jgi:AraC-like DNA-binding protein
MPFTGLARQALEKMKEYIAEHGTERIPIRALAQSLGLSPRHFRRIVRQITGKSPQEFVTLWKIQHAKNLLQSGTHNVSEAAIATGFSDPAHLNRRMQAIYGVSPKAFLPRLPRPFRA